VVDLLIHCVSSTLKAIQHLYFILQTSCILGAVAVRIGTGLQRLYTDARFAIDNTAAGSVAVDRVRNEVFEATRIPQFHVNTTNFILVASRW
jgi:hypothetical protein